VKFMRNRWFASQVLAITLAAILGTSSGLVRPAFGQSAATPSTNFVHFNPPPFDFNDNFYTENGIDLTNLDSAGAARFGLFRQFGPPATQRGQANWVVDNTGTDPDRTNIRILANTGGYSDDGLGSPSHFITIIAFLLNQNFFTGVANARGIQMVDIVNTLEAYAANKQILPNGQFAGTPCGTMGDGTLPCFPVTSVATPTLRQDWRFAVNRGPIDGSSPFGYFCDDLLGMWIITYFWYTNAGAGRHPNSVCRAMLASLAQKNGITLDGTPVIKTPDELNFLEGQATTDGVNPIPGFLGTNPPPVACAAEGNEDPGGADGGAVWLVCPAMPDPTAGAIAPDAFLDHVTFPNGQSVDPGFLQNFNCLKNTGQFCSPAPSAIVNKPLK
jgi:hypothetical protein